MKPGLRRGRPTRTPLQENLFLICRGRLAGDPPFFLGVRGGFTGGFDGAKEAGECCFEVGREQQ